MEYELYHWGIKGMKWGIRRFQNKDGSLTPSGRKRYGDGSDGSSGGGKSKTAKAKSTKDMTDDELRTRINRLQLEKNALDLEKQVSSLSPQKVAKGQGFVQKIGKEVIAPALLNAGRAQLTNFLNDRLSKALGLNSKDDMAALRKTVDELNLKKQKSELEKYFKSDGKEQTSESDVLAALRKTVDELNLKKQKSELEKYFKSDGKEQTSESDVLAKLAKDLENKGKIAKNAQYSDIEEILKALLEKEKKV